MSQEHEPVGSLGEEAVKFLGAFSSWAAQQGGEFGRHVEDLGSHACDQVRHGLHELDEHLATGSAECTVCPVCRGVSLVRQMSPEVKAHLRTAASSLVHAAAGILATVTPESEGGGEGGSSRAASRGASQEARVQHIDLDGEWDEDPDR